MSIINDTLKALEEKNRKTQSQDKIGQLGSMSSSSKEKRSRVKNKLTNGFLWGVIGFGGVALVIIVLTMMHHSKKPLPIGKNITIVSPEKKPPNVHQEKKSKEAHPQETNGLTSSPAKKDEVTLSSIPLSHHRVSPKEIASDLNEAVEANDQKRFHELVQHVQNAKDWHALAAKVVTHLSSKSHFVASERFLRSLMSEHMNDWVLTQALAKVYSDEDNLDKAISLLQSSSVPIASNPGYYAFLAFLLVKDKRYAESVPVYQQLVSIDSSNARWWMGLGVSYLYLGKNHDALESFERAQAHAGAHASFRYFLSHQIHQLQGDAR